MSSARYRIMVDVDRHAQPVQVTIETRQHDETIGYVTYDPGPFDEAISVFNDALWQITTLMQGEQLTLM